MGFTHYMLCLLTAVAAQAQTEAALKTFFEGKKALVKLDLPAGREGIDIYPKAVPMVDFKSYSGRLRYNGPALLKGNSATVSAVRIKENGIEFRFSRGEYGTLGDDIPHSFDVPEAAKRHSLGYALIHIRYPDKSLKISIPAPKELLPILSEYVDFGGGSQVSSSGMRSSASAKLKKGMSEVQVLNIFGAPRESRVHVEGNVKTITNTFQQAGESIEVDFVKNVVVDFRIRPK